MFSDWCTLVVTIEESFSVIVTVVIGIEPEIFQVFLPNIVIGKRYEASKASLVERFPR